MDYQVADCGLALVVDPDKKIRILRRTEKSIGGKSYPAMSISDPRFSWHGYSRWYPD